MRKVALITGGTKGIGKACAICFAKKNIDIVINYRNNEEAANALTEELKSFGIDAIAIRADVSDSNQVKYLFDECMKHFDRLDILINNVGIAEDSFLMMLSDGDLDKSFNTNVKSYFYCSRQAALKMFRRRKGKIINISSVSSMKAIAGQTVYSATKGAINSLTRVLAKELAHYGVQVNGVAPGFIDTDMLQKLTSEQKNDYINSIPMKRFGTAEEVAELVCFLCSDNANYMTGQTLILDGGLSL